jgi:hypothetical protein
MRRVAEREIEAIRLFFSRRPGERERNVEARYFNPDFKLHFLDTQQIDATHSLMPKGQGSHCKIRV